MQTKVNIGVLRDAVTQALHTLDTKETSIGSNLYMIAKPGLKGPDTDGALYIYSSNLGLSRTLQKIKADVTKSGMAMIKPKLLLAAMSGLPETEDIDLALSASGNKLEVKYGQVKSQIAVHADSAKAAEVLPTFSAVAEPDITVSASTLVDIINRTLFCTTSGANAVSEGVWLSNVHLSAGDGSLVGTATNRIIAGTTEIHDGLVKGKFDGGVHRDALVALKALLSKRKAEGVTITNASSQGNNKGSNEILFRFSDVILGVRQLSTPYPKAVAGIFNIPGGFSCATMDRKILLGVFGRLAAFAEKSSFTLSFSADKASLMTKGYSSTFQEQVAKIEKNDGTITIGLGVSDVLAVLGAMASAEVEIHYKTGDDHVFFQEGDGSKYVLSPVSVDWAKGK